MFIERLSYNEIKDFVQEATKMQADSIGKIGDEQVVLIYNTEGVNQEKSGVYLKDFECRSQLLNSTTKSLKKQWKQFMYSKFGEEYKQAFNEDLKRKFEEELIK